MITALSCTALTAHSVSHEYVALETGILVTPLVIGQELRGTTGIYLAACDARNRVDTWQSP